MADFAELMSLLRNPGDDGLPTNFADELQTAYDETVATHTQQGVEFTEKLTAAETAREAAETAKLATQAHNARLLRSIPAKPNDDQGNAGNDGQGGDQFPKPVTIDSLIEYK